MHAKNILIFLLLLLVSVSCEKVDIETITVEGVVRDDASQKPIAGLTISIDGIKSPTGVGIITDGKRENLGYSTTDSQGHYSIKLKVFKSAERLEFSLNPGNQMEGYVYSHEDFYISNLVKNSTNKIDLVLSPTTILKIFFKNESPISDLDFFYFGWYADKGNGWTRGLIKKENCGTVVAGEAVTWTGKDVCGIFTTETVAEQDTRVYWTVKKNGVTKNYGKSVFMKRDIVNEFYLNY